MIEVRCHLPSVDEYVALIQAVGWTVAGREACERALAGTVVGIGAFDGDQLVGMGRLIGDGAENWVLVDLVVDPTYQGGGVGTAITTALEAEVARSSPGSTVLLFCSARVVPFYERLGYQISPGIFMKKTLREVGCPGPPGRAGGDPISPWRSVVPPRRRSPAIPGAPATGDRG